MKVSVTEKQNNEGKNNDKQNVTGDLLVFPKATYITVIRELLKASISLV